MNTWPDGRILTLLQIDLPIIQAPMAGAVTAAMVVAIAEAGGLGSLPGAMLTPRHLKSEVNAIRKGTLKPFNLNFFCHPLPVHDPAREAAWRRILKSHYGNYAPEAEAPASASHIGPFNEAAVELIEDVTPAIVSFHFGLPDEQLLQRVKGTGAKVLSSATTVEEALWLESRGCDAIIAQGIEAGGHRGSFLSTDITNQLGTFALVPQIADAVKVPVIAAGGISDARGIAAALTLGASAVQIGTAYLHCPEANVSPVYRNALMHARGDETILTNVFTGRAARAVVNRFIRDVGPMSAAVPQFPLASDAVAPLRRQSEPSVSPDFVPMWAGQAVRLGRSLPAGELTHRLADETLAKLGARRDER